MVMVLPITPFVGGDLWRLEKKRGQTGFERVGRTLAATRSASDGSLKRHGRKCFLHRLAYVCGKFCDAGCKKSVRNRMYRLANLALLWFNVMV